ncbi:hypothetical protein HCI96_05540 [Listeria seeligeri]|uniref:hypothetical protein n=1 Tax=Listeria seeligeri TaxID=1640 RepID=UPI0016285EC5|nr:hypothetical protein [Listeria seeligeri]MBC1442615.1 hypothetical protein [Listeria seeligeri]MBC1542095.1 hypothetical protein [Listeria seeligeri]MBC1582651.1 hypothetical protein [Listeria seeligeri]MBC1772657.1 hypothetical protein [Listeria seeligeri]MBC1826605.1 hypothetical protein [Listeria seeligeri]
MNNVSYENAKQKINSQEIEQLNSKIEHTSSYTGKIVGSILFALLLGLPAINYYAIYLVGVLIFLSILAVKYVTLKPIFKILNYNMVLFLVWQTAAIFFMIVFLRVKADTYHLIPSLYIILSYGFSFLLVRARINTYVKEAFGEIHNSKKSIFSKTITKILSVFLVVVVVAVLFYRGNKWWLMHMNATVETPSFFVYAVWGIGLLVLLIGFTLLPTLLFSPSQYVKGRLIKKYSEEFRQEYGFTEKEWYGEK